MEIKNLILVYSKKMMMKFLKFKKKIKEKVEKNLNVMVLKDTHKNLNVFLIMQLKIVIKLK